METAESKNDNQLVNPEDVFSPTWKEVNDYMKMGYTQPQAISSLTTTKRNQVEEELGKERNELNADEEWFDSLESES